MSGFGGSLWGSTGQQGPPPPGTFLAQSLIYLALRRIGHLRPGYQPSPELLNDLIMEWQIFFDALDAERNMNYSLPMYEYNITGPGSQTNGNGYQIGPTAIDWVGPRPDSIVWANLVMLNVPSQPVYLPLRSISLEEWASLPIQQIPPISVTSLFYYDPQFPNGVFNVFPPLSAGNQIQLYTFGVLPSPSSLSDIYGGPPGYAEMVVSCMAVRAFPLVSKELAIHPAELRVLKQQAYDALQRLRLINRPIQRLCSDFHSRRNNAIPAYDQFTHLVGTPY